jgi:hypothetical protein
MVMLADLHVATVAMIGKLTEELKTERAKEVAAIDEAVRTKLYIGDKYWERRHMIEQRLRAARNLLSVTE